MPVGQRLDCHVQHPVGAAHRRYYIVIDIRLLPAARYGIVRTVILGPDIYFVGGDFIKYLADKLATGRTGTALKIRISFETYNIARFYMNSIDRAAPYRIGRKTKGAFAVVGSGIIQIGAVVLIGRKSVVIIAFVVLIPATETVRLVPKV